MTELLEVIHTTRLIAGGDGVAVHQHYQHVTPDGELIVEWCVFDDECTYVKDPEVTL